MLSVTDLGDGKMAEKTVDGRAKRSLLQILKSLACPPPGIMCQRR